MAATAYPSPPTLPSFAPGAIARALKERAAKASSPDPNAAEEAGSPVTPSVDDDGKVRPAVSEVVILDATGEEVHGEEQVTPEVVEPPSQVSPWPALMASASDHTDDHLAKVRSLAPSLVVVVLTLLFAGHPNAGIRSDALWRLASWDLRLVASWNRHHGRQYLCTRFVPASPFSTVSLTFSCSCRPRLPRCRLGTRRRPNGRLGSLRPRL